MSNTVSYRITFKFEDALKDGLLAIIPVLSTTTSTLGHPTSSWSEPEPWACCLGIALINTPYYTPNPNPNTLAEF
ncbi:hypothetical protein O181_059907 [Austropuccinia psidii MF-1]|uniref:Uncharacterized protein n=1 Tax=Austropuccinia psidii MF-1 TaxID=1389203 RepID=A0A9Q3EHL1_9BASI|nr:hypothetical protein [Austropuccinia psidii MF-1]